MNQQTIIDAVRDYLDDNDWKYEFLAEDGPCPAIRMGLTLRCRIRSISYRIAFPNDLYFTVTATSPIKAGPDNLVATMRFITMANYGLFDGNFEMDVSDGEIRYKCFINCEDLDAIPPVFVERGIHVPASMFERYGDGLAAIALGFSDNPDEEIRKAESDDEEEEEDDED